jgi:hypothetical protein
MMNGSQNVSGSFAKGAGEFKLFNDSLPQWRGDSEMKNAISSGSL